MDKQEESKSKTLSSSKYSTNSYDQTTCSSGSQNSNWEGKVIFRFMNLNISI